MRRWSFHWQKQYWARQSHNPNCSMVGLCSVAQAPTHVSLQAFTANLTKVNRLRAEIAALKQSCSVGLDGLADDLTSSTSRSLQQA